jgi:hypothetical protein
MWDWEISHEGLKMRLAEFLTEILNLEGDISLFSHFYRCKIGFAQVRKPFEIFLYHIPSSVSPDTPISARVRQLLGARAVSPRGPKYLCLNPSSRGCLALKF